MSAPTLAPNTRLNPAPIAAALLSLALAPGCLEDIEPFVPPQDGTASYSPDAMRRIDPARADCDYVTGELITAPRAFSFINARPDGLTLQVHTLDATTCDRVLLGSVAADETLALSGVEQDAPYLVTLEDDATPLSAWIYIGPRQTPTTSFNAFGIGGSVVLLP